jgi:mannose/cellobiose epimerase-like protein (N-acyl-D-glucosamine 2-epimerase family)
MPDDSSTDLKTWIARNLTRQLNFGRTAILQRGGSGWMTDDGSLDATQPQFTWLTARMVHVWSLATAMGVPGASHLAERAFEGLSGVLHDPLHGGWFASAGPRVDAIDSTKECYTQAHVVVAAASASGIGVAGARDALDDALTILEEYFWDESTGMFGESYRRDWSVPSARRSATSNMHCVEAMLSAAAVPDIGPTRSVLLERCVRIMDRLARRQAAAHNWRMPQHFSEQWRPLLAFNNANRWDPFAPFGATIGLGFEWARLAVAVDTALGSESPGWLLDCARNLHSRAAADGWGSDGNEGFVYTTDWNGNPVIDRRLHWVQAEAVSSAATLLGLTGERQYADHYVNWWKWVRTVIVDEANGSWRHELDPHGVPSSLVWRGRPDLYHSVHAALLSIGPIASTPLEVSRQIEATIRAIAEEPEDASTQLAMDQ